MKCDLSNKNQVNNIFDNIKPDIIIHTAALIDIDYCEKNKKLSYLYNVKSTENIITWINSQSNKNKIKLVFISSDQVYGKCKNNIENNGSPLNTYGKHKYLSEKKVRKIKNYLVLRTNFLSKGVKKTSLTDWIVDSFLSKKSFDLFNNVYFNPLSVQKLSKIIFRMVRLNLIGTYNLGSTYYNAQISKADFAIMLAKKLKIYNKNYNLKSFNKSKHFVNRPNNLIMKIDKIEKYIKMPSIKVVLSDIVKIYRNEKK